MNHNNGKKILQLTVLAGCLCVASYYLFLYFSAHQHPLIDVAIQNFQDEVDDDVKSCTDGADDCRKNEEVFDATWLAVQSKENMDPYLQFPKEMWQDDEKNTEVGA